MAAHNTVTLRSACSNPSGLEQSMLSMHFSLFHATGSLPTTRENSEQFNIYTHNTVFHRTAQSTEYSFVFCTMYCDIQGQPIKKPNYFLNLLLYLQLNQTCLLQSTPLHSWYTAPNIFSSSGTCFVGWRKGPVSNFLLSPLASEIGDLLVRTSTSGTRKSLQGPNLESRVAGRQHLSHASSKIHR